MREDAINPPRPFAFLVLGPHSRKASTEQKRRFTDALYNFLLRQYATGLLEFTSDRLNILPYKGAADATRATVRTEVYLDDGTEVPVYYKLRLTDEGWKVYDVTVENISYVKNFRTQFGAEIQARGLDALIERLEAEVADEPDTAAEPSETADAA
jgi:phospholipid transport system substrate-binding protein